MRRVLKLKRFGLIVAYIALLGGIIATGALLGHYMHTQRLKAISTSPEALRSNANQVYLAASSLGSIGNNLPTADIAIRAQKTALETSIKDTLDILKSRRSVDPSIATELEKQLVQQQKLFDEYNVRYEALAKAISYNPSLDLDLDTAKHADVIKSRAEAASTNLHKLAEQQNLAQNNGTLAVSGGYNLPDTAARAVSRVALCFKQVSEATNATLNETRSRCISSYAVVRKTLVEQLLEVYHTQHAKNSLSALAGVITQL